MSSMIKVKNRIISWKYLIAAIPIVLYALSNRQSMPFFEELHNVTANFWDYIFMSFSDVYLLLFYFFPLILFISTVYINRTFEYIELIRLGSYKKWIFTRLEQLFKIDIFFILMFLGSILLTSFNTSFSMEWSSVGIINVSGNEILYYLRHYFPTPFVALVLQIGLLLLTTITFQLMLCILYARFKKPSLLYLLNGLMYLYGSISFKVFPASMKLIVMPNYLSLFHGVASFDSIIMPFVIVLSVLLFLIFIANNIDRDYRNSRNYLVKNLPVLGYGLLCLMGILFHISKQSNGELSIWDGFIVTFMGTTNEIFTLISFTFYIVVFLGAVYFVQLRLQRYLSEMSYYTMIRYRSINKWFLSWFPGILKIIMILLLTLLAGTISIAMLKGYSITVPENLFEILYHFIVNGFLQLLFYVIFVIIISFATKDVFKSFITLLTLTVFMLPGFRLNNLMPIGLNSMGYVLEGYPVFLISIKLAVYIAAEVIVLLYLFNKKDYIV
ncbi:hypothetical protein [Ureibacillus thermosphaericus]|uniref:hypothetical protein n=1 Tax=Ureibacillus thermosphaericus TaxID=51173 RepID=UPI000BBBD4DC|nr:hypothetical protein [Ureibacillus thermosphaericus]